MEENKQNFFRKMWTSIQDFEGYQEFAADKISKAICYILLITLIFTFIIALVYTYKFNLAIEDINNYINENIEEISLIDGKLKIEPEKEIIIEDENNIIPIIIVMTSEESNENEYLERLKAYNIGILLLSDRAVVKTNALANEESISYSSIFPLDIQDKSEVLNILTYKNLLPTYALFFITIFIYLYIVYFMSNLIDALVLGAIGYLFARLVKIRLKYKATFNIGIHALTLPIILNLIYIIVNTFTGFEIRYFQWMYTSISYIYVAVAILMIKTEIINQKIQLIQLKQIQKKVAEEAEENEIPEETPKENKEKEEKSNDEKEEKTSGEQPEGSNA